MPVHSVHHDTVQTEAAIENLINAPASMLSNAVCFDFIYSFFN